MGFLPDLDANGRIIEKKPKLPNLPKNAQVMYCERGKPSVPQSFLDWDNLILNRCPSCGEIFPQKDGDRECTNHQGRPFKVPGFKFAKIVHDIENKDRFPRFE